MPRLLDTGPPEVRELLAVGLEDAPGKHLLPALRSALGASLVVSGAAVAGSAATSATSMVASASTSGTFAKSTATGAAVVAKTSVSLIAAKALASGLLVGSALCGGAILTGVGQRPALVHRSARSELSAPSAEKGSPASHAQRQLGAAAPFEAPNQTQVLPRNAPGSEPLPLVEAELAEAPSALQRSRKQRDAGNGKRTHAEPASTAVTSGEALPVLPAEAPAPKPTAQPEAPNLLALEIARVDEARALLNSGKPDAALAALKSYDPTSPSAVLG
ncbi:MAG TPA: hypothetical protein VFQ35_04305, partial [Polyangiaceae bacterium]|nr:hypothetical protein [Polyangiaceae bacterium]